ncbi:transposase [Mesorhizobium sp. M3A.F.Ca.ET.174.01.1.1]|nr:transposase [Mesorhizobium sp. M3A.F.Ca.ET.175.01.1.1]TGT22321.1 transposase [Mesorhizobium sp. M3A.F.Ca.ET.174.01.1.1]
MLRVEVRGPPLMIVSDNGTELTSWAILQWQHDHRVEWHYIAPGKPIQCEFRKSRTEILLSRGRSFH